MSLIDIFQTIIVLYKIHFLNKCRYNFKREYKIHLPSFWNDISKENVQKITSFYFEIRWNKHELVHSTCMQSIMELDLSRSGKVLPELLTFPGAHH